MQSFLNFVEINNKHQHALFCYAFNIYEIYCQEKMRVSIDFVHRRRTYNLLCIQSRSHDLINIDIFYSLITTSLFVMVMDLYPKQL